GRMIPLWREARRTRVPPSSSEVEAARRRTGWTLIELDPERRAVRLARPGMRLDLGGVAKGYAADEALAVLREHGIERALVELGGDIVVGAPPPGERDWTMR